MRGSVENALRKAFRPEFLNRIDEILIFDPLTQDEILSIVDLMISNLQKQLIEREIELSLSKEAKVWIAKQGFDAEFGARPLRLSLIHI